MSSPKYDNLLSFGPVEHPSAPACPGAGICKSTPLALPSHKSLTSRLLGVGLWMIAALGVVPPAAVGQEGAADDLLNSGQPNGVRVTDRGRVRMHVADRPLSEVLHLLSLGGKRNIVTSPEVTGTVTANLYDVTFEEALEAILIANRAGFRMVDNFVYVHTEEQLLAIAEANAPAPFTRVYRLNYVTSEDARSYISSLVGNDGSISVAPPADSGLKSDPDKGGGNMSAAQDFVIVTARPAAHEEIEKVLAQIDIRPKQVLIEATILRAELTDDNALGIDFTLVGGVDLQMLGASSAGLTDLSLGTLPTNRFERFNAAAATGFTSDVPNGGITIGIIKDNVGIFLRALEAVTNITVLANPKVLALNRQKGQVIVGRRDGFITTTVTETKAIQTVEFLETGTQLIFRPFIGDDGYVRVELHPEDSVGFVNAQGLPSEQTTEVTTNVIIRNHQTILIAGLFREVTTDARSQIPGLGNLPGVGALFRSNTETTSREEVIILLTIHIVDDDDAYARASNEQLNNIERLRVGVRQGLMWQGRERNAQTHYAKALNASASGEREKTLWHLNMSLHNNNRFLPAIKFKEKMLSERAWDEDGTGGRTFLRMLISNEEGYALPPFGRPEPVILKPRVRPGQKEAATKDKNL